MIPESSIATSSPTFDAVMPARHYLNESGGWRSWLLTTDHKRIGLLYLLSITVFFFLGGFFALLIRLELLTPASDLMTPDVYNRAFTMHGVIMRAGLERDAIESDDPDRGDGEGRAGAGRGRSTAIRRSFGSKGDE